MVSTRYGLNKGSHQCIALALEQASRECLDSFSRVVPGERHRAGAPLFKRTESCVHTGGIKLTVSSTENFSLINVKT